MDTRRHPLLTFSGYVVGYLLGLAVSFGLGALGTWITLYPVLKRKADAWRLELAAATDDLITGTGLDNRSGHDERSRQELPEEPA